MKYVVLKPEVAGGLGERTVIQDRSVHPPIVSRLHYQFDGWMGDEFLASFPCYIVTRRVAERLGELGATGFELDTVEISRSGQFMDMHPELALPEFVWLKIVGKPGVDDFGMAGVRLVVSERALQCLKEFKLQFCRILDYSPE